VHVVPKVIAAGWHSNGTNPICPYGAADFLKKSKSFRRKGYTPISYVTLNFFASLHYTSKDAVACPLTII